MEAAQQQEEIQFGDVQMDEIMNDEEVNLEIANLALQERPAPPAPAIRPPALEEVHERRAAAQPALQAAAAQAPAQARPPAGNARRGRAQQAPPRAAVLDNQANAPNNEVDRPRGTRGGRKRPYVNPYERDMKNATFVFANLLVNMAKTCNEETKRRRMEEQQYEHQ